MNDGIDPFPENDASPAQAAADWFARSRSPGFGRDDQNALAAWLDQSPDYGEAYLRVIELWRETESLHSHPSVLKVRDVTKRRYRATSRRRSVLIAAACACAAVAAGLGAMAYRDAAAPKPVTQVFQTEVGQTAHIALMDGSKLTLDTDTTVHAVIGPHKRELLLDRGRVYFKVAKDKSRPFIVTADGRSVTATGTEFEVRSEARHFEVLLVEGRVRVSQPASRNGGVAGDLMSTDLEPGTRLVGGEDGRWILARAEGQADLAWMRGQLVFKNRPVGEIAAEMNRYSRRKIVVSDARIANRSVFGAFMAGDVDQFVRALIDSKIARIQSQTDNSVVLTAP